MFYPKIFQFINLLTWKSLKDFREQKSSFLKDITTDRNKQPNHLSHSWARNDVTNQTKACGSYRDNFIFAQQSFPIIPIDGSWQSILILSHNSSFASIIILRIAEHCTKYLPYIFRYCRNIGKSQDHVLISQWGFMSNYIKHDFILILIEDDIRLVIILTNNLVISILYKLDQNYFW